MYLSTHKLPHALRTHLDWPRSNLADCYDSCSKASRKKGRAVGDPVTVSFVFAKHTFSFSKVCILSEGYYSVTVTRRYNDREEKEGELQAIEISRSSLFTMLLFQQVCAQ